MSLRNKTYLMLLLATILFLLGVYTLIWRTTEKELKNLQYQHAEEQLSLVARILERELEVLTTSQTDWAKWDDTYQFLADRNEEYIVSNLNDESFDFINVDLMVFVNNAGEITYAKQMPDGKSGSNEIPDDFLNYFRGESALLDFRGEEIFKHGILTAPEKTLFVSVQPISTSDGKGARRGTLIFGRYIDVEYVQKLSSLAGLKLQITPYGFTELKDGKGGMKTLQSNSRVAVEYVDNTIVAHRLIDNIFGNPSLLLRVEYPSNILHEGREFLFNGLWYSLIALVSYVSVLIVLIDYFLLRRIERMRRIARQVSVLQSGELPEGDVDDFSYLATVMVGALKTIQQSKEMAVGSQSELFKYEKAFDNSFDHMIITDPDGKILYANAAAEALTGYTREEMIGQTPALWGKQMPGEFYRDLWNTIRLHKQLYAGEIINKNKNGVRYRALIRITPILDKDKRALYFIGIERWVGKA